ncbi:hypothetical protein BDN72DRAFT_860999 [Pluteus cervinus]|uniref:Uncharacterized protein n=1 Tax=Pluteus cervinus TaxID=181527 RepID=A0ACD3AI49_9AGAR|nr:hypothetical protein BDN72DRAFT_860999 [Pluteus cervinus]
MADVTSSKSPLTVCCFCRPPNTRYLFMFGISTKSVHVEIVTRRGIFPRSYSTAQCQRVIPRVQPSCQDDTVTTNRRPTAHMISGSFVIGFFVVLGQELLFAILHGLQFNIRGNGHRDQPRGQDRNHEEKIAGAPVDPGVGDDEMRFDNYICCGQQHYCHRRRGLPIDEHHCILKRTLAGIGGDQASQRGTRICC